MTAIPAPGAAWRVLVLGTGALAKRYGAQLAMAWDADGRARQTVVLCGGWAEAVAAIEARGVVLELTDGREVRARVGATTREALLRAMERPPHGLRAAFDLVLVLVKSHQTATVAGLAAAAVAPHGRILTLQNGLGNEAILCAAAADPDRVLLGVTTVGATGLGPGRVRAGGPGLSQIARAEGPGLTSESIAERLSEAGLPCEVRADLAPVIWRKLAVNAAINPLSALLGLTNGELLADGERWPLARAAAREVARVARARGVELGPQDAAAWPEEVARLTGANRSSMLQDLDRGAATEVGAICGAALEEAAALGLDAPVNAWLLASVRFLEGGGDRGAIDWSTAPRLAEPELAP